MEEKRILKYQNIFSFEYKWDYKNYRKSQTE